MKPTIVLIRPYGRDDGARCVPWGIISLASYLKKFGYDVQIIDRKESLLPARRIADYVRGIRADYAGISAMTTQSPDAEVMCRYLKGCGAKTLLGGLHYSIFPEEGLAVGDYVFLGESEKSLLNFLRNGPDRNIYNEDPVRDLDEIPLPDEKFFKNLYINKNYFTIITSRGCGYDCSFCIDKKYRGKVIRYHSPQYVCDLIEMMKKSFGVNSFFVGDDVFTVNKERVLAVCQEIRKRSLNIKLGGFTHAGIDDPQIYRELKSAGFETMNLGVESGSDEVLKAMGKHQTVAQAKKTIGVIKNAGLTANIMLMVGNIMETEEGLKKTFDLVKELGLNGWVSYAQPYPGTRFYEVNGKYGRLVNYNPATYWNDKITFIPAGVSRLRLKYYRDRIAAALKAPLPLTARLLNKIYPA